MPFPSSTQEFHQAELYKQIADILQNTGYDEEACIFHKASEATKLKADTIVKTEAIRRQFEERYKHLFDAIPPPATN